MILSGIFSFFILYLNYCLCSSYVGCFIWYCSFVIFIGGLANKDINVKVSLTHHFLIICVSVTPKICKRNLNCIFSIAVCTCVVHKRCHNQVLTKCPGIKDSTQDEVRVVQVAHRRSTLPTYKVEPPPWSSGGGYTGGGMGVCMCLLCCFT